MPAAIIDPVIVKVSTANTEQDLINNSGDSREMSLLIHISNDASTDATVELWITNASNTRLFPLMPASTMKSKTSVVNSTKLVLKAGNKVRITSSNTDTYAMICPILGV